MKKILIILFLVIPVVILGQTPYVVTDVDTTATTGSGYQIPRTSPILLTVKNSSFKTAFTGSSYNLLCGDDNYVEGQANNLDNATITGNVFKYTGGDLGAPSLHNVMAGYNKNYHIKFNYFDSCGYSILLEGVNPDTTDIFLYTNGGISYNIIHNDEQIRFGGIEGLRIYNNTFYHSTASTGAQINIVESIPSRNISIRNNVFYRKHGTVVIECPVGLLATLSCDYNVYYCEDGDPRFAVNGLGIRTWAQWRALGFDTHSVIVNPNFADTITMTPTARLNYGTDLGEIHNSTEYDFGLSINPEWVVGTHPDTVAQNGLWQVGAVIFPDSNVGDYYVSTAGSDSWSGTLAAPNEGNTDGPWATWQKAFNTANNGDTVYFRGGTYMPSSKAYGWSITTITPDAGYGHNGTYLNPICFYAYPDDYAIGSIPILDGSLASNTAGNNGIGIQEATYIKFKGLEITNILQLTLGPTVAGIYASDCGYLSFENMDVHHIEGEGVWIRGYDTLYLVNSDSHNNCDSLGDEIHVKGGMGDGFLLSSRAASAADSIKTVYITGCRAWHNSDDGFDMNVQETYVSNSWSWGNGPTRYGEDFDGDGTGFKTNTGLIRLPSKKTFHNNITAYCHNASSGSAALYFTNFEEGLGTIYSYYNNISFHDDRVTGSLTPGDFDIDNYNAQVANNIVISPVASYIGSFDAAGSNYLTYPYAHLYTNTFQIDTDNPTGKCETNPAFTVTAGDFVSLDTAELRWPRQSDGSLPVINFGKLVAGSDLINTGTDVGLDYNGAAPDLGWYEFLELDSSAHNIITFTIPNQQGASVIDTSAHTIAITMPYGTDASALTPTITVSDSATIDPASGVETDFSSPVTYTVTAFDSSTQEWTVTVTVSTNPYPSIVIVSANYIHAIAGSATCNVLYDGGGTVTAKGVCWSTSDSPTIADRHTVDGSGEGSYTSRVIGLQGGNTYYVRAYATNAYGTVYSNQESFTTPVNSKARLTGNTLKYNGQTVIVR